MWKVPDTPEKLERETGAAREHSHSTVFGNETRLSCDLLLRLPEQRAADDRPHYGSCATVARHPSLRMSKS
jgi:hypothetical protein